MAIRSCNWSKFPQLIVLEPLQVIIYIKDVLTNIWEEVNNNNGRDVELPPASVW